MDTETKQLIQERFNDLPNEIKGAITASDLPEKIKKIAADNNLLLDQVSDLQNEILFVLLGIEPSSDFVGNVSKELSVNNLKALAIAKQVNATIFDAIREKLREMEERLVTDDAPEETQNSKGISDLEKLGGFTIEKPIVEPKIDVTRADRPAILNGVENPTPVTPVIPRPYKPIDPLIDHLLTSPVTSAEQKVEIKPLSKPQPAISTPPVTTPPKPSGPDSYREPIA
ncbi:MAG: hypothetical protein WCG07_00395 [Candidatus Taylorbacteria bacterium]